MALFKTLYNNFITRSIAGCRIPLQLKGFERPGSILLSRTVTLKPFPAQPPSTADYDERNMKLGRPQSPHLTIYAPQLTSMLSITHRMTGAALAGMTSAIGIAALVLPDPLTSYIEVIESYNLGVEVLMAGKAILAFPLAYHTCNGVRHLLWDTGRFLTLKQVYITGYIMVLMAIGATAGLLTQ